MSDKLSDALYFVEKAKKVLEIEETMADWNKPYSSCSFTTSHGIHIYSGIERLAIDLGIDELIIYTYPNDKEPNQKQFAYDGVGFFQLLDVCEKADLIRSGAKTIQLSEVESANNK